MQETNHSLAELFDELVAIATGLGLILFVAFPFAIPFIALVVAVVAPVMLLMAVTAVLTIAPLLLLARITRKLRTPAPTRAHPTPALQNPARTGSELNPPELHSEPGGQEPRS
ncbi:MAG: hypothetical protein ACRDPA_34605, partial [Solirubrobacteraceae bacterium]